MSGSRRVAQLGLLPVLVVLAGCSTLSGNSPDPFAGPGSADAVRLYVQNDNFYDARVSAVIGGVRQQLGYVGGKQDGVFNFPFRFSQDVSFEFDLLAGPTCRTEIIPVDPGDTLQLQILSDPSAGFCR